MCFDAKYFVIGASSVTSKSSKFISSSMWHDGIIMPLLDTYVVIHSIFCPKYVLFVICQAL